MQVARGGQTLVVTRHEKVIMGGDFTARLRELAAGAALVANPAPEVFVSTEAGDDVTADIILVATPAFVDGNIVKFWKREAADAAEQPAGEYILTIRATTDQNELVTLKDSRGRLPWLKVEDDGVPD